MLQFGWVMVFPAPPCFDVEVEKSVPLVFVSSHGSVAVSLWLAKIALVQITIVLVSYTVSSSILRSFPLLVYRLMLSTGLVD